MLARNSFFAASFGRMSSRISSMSQLVIARLGSVLQVPAYFRFCGTFAMNLFQAANRETEVDGTTIHDKMKST